MDQVFRVMKFLTFTDNSVPIIKCQDFETLQVIVDEGKADVNGKNAEGKSLLFNILEELIRAHKFNCDEQKQFDFFDKV
jgi:hypothetical protein